jgi:hypothetical protein
MADTKVSALTAVSAAAGAQELPCNDAGTSKKVTVTQLKSFINPTTVVALSSNATANATTTGVEITGLQATGIAAGTYIFQYFIRGQSSAAGTGLKFGINFTGTTTFVFANLYQNGTGTTAVTGTGDQVNTAAQICEVFGSRSLSTTAPNLGPTLGVDTANADILYTIEGMIQVSTSGDLELWHGSETAASTQVMAGSCLFLTKVV